jgi:hypothetical protein
LDPPVLTDAVASTDELTPLQAGDASKTAIKEIKGVVLTSMADNRPFEPSPLAKPDLATF